MRGTQPQHIQVPRNMALTSKLSTKQPLDRRPPSNPNIKIANHTNDRRSQIPSPEIQSHLSPGARFKTPNPHNPPQKISFPLSKKCSISNLQKTLQDSTQPDEYCLSQAQTGLPQSAIRNYQNTQRKAKGPNAFWKNIDFNNGPILKGTRPIGVNCKIFLDRLLFLRALSRCNFCEFDLFLSFH